MRELEREYTYLWAPVPGGYHNPVLRIQSPAYALELNSEGRPGLARVGALADASPEPEGEEALFAGLEPVETSLSIRTERGEEPCTGSELCYTAPEWYWCAPSKYRIIESGRYVNTADVMHLVFADRDLLGRFEVKAFPDCFVLTFDGYSKRPVPGAELCLSLRSQTPAVRLSSGHARWGEAEVFADGLEVQDGALVLRRAVPLANRFDGISLMLRFGNAKARREELPFSVRNLRRGQRTAIEFDEQTGMYRVLLSDDRAPDFREPEERNEYDRVRFTIRNDTGERRFVPIRFEKSGPAVSLTGVSPTLRHAKTGEPIGLPVQITKDWHIHPDKASCGEWFATAPDDPRRHLEGQWLHAYACPELAPGEEFTAEYTCAYENWGTVCAASHAQLSLVGWGGYTIWEQLALGSHGENICFNTDNSSHSCSFINDVRPIYQRGKWGSFEEYNWTGNVGGGQLLVYVDEQGERRELCGHHIDFEAQCPVLTQELVKCTSQDRRIDCEYSINAVRTDDLTRILFRVRYDFREDTDFERLAFFQYDTELYQANLFRRFAVGNADGILRDEAFEPDERVESGYLPRYEKEEPLPGRDGWFFWYDTPKGPGYDGYDGYLAELCDQKNADQLTIVREYAAEINGRRVDEPSYNIFQCYSTGHRHPSFELTVPRGTKRVKKGSWAAFTIEFVTLPATPEHYYGPSAFVEACKPVFGDPRFALKVAREGRTTVSASRGEVLSAYPVCVRADGDEAQFTVRGGLGRVPVRIEGVSSPEGARLFRKTGGRWVRVDQSVRGNDFWQADRETRAPALPGTEKYTFPY